MNNNELILRSLKALRDNGPCDPTRGICHSLLREMRILLNWRDYDEIVGDCMTIVEEKFFEWPDFSGRKSYPICHPQSNWLDDGDVQDAAAEAFHSNMPKWDKEHPYGAKRWQLLEWLIEKLEAEIEQETTD